MNISLILTMAAEAAPERTALVSGGRRWDYRSLLNAAVAAAELFRKSGAEYVALLDENSEAAPIALFGAAIVGIPYVPLNYRLADQDLAILLGRIKPACVIGDEERARSLAKGTAQMYFSREAFCEAVSAVSVNHDAWEPADASVAVQIFTSGTTATPKAAILGHDNLLSYILGTVGFASSGEDESTLVSVPPYHIAGTSALLSSIYSLRTILMLPSFDPDAWLELARTEKATHAFLVPTMMARVLAKIEAGAPIGLSALQAIAYGGGRMPREVIERALDLFPQVKFTNAYGLTETSSTIALLGPEDHRRFHASSDPATKARLASVGQPLPTIDLEIRDRQGAIVEPGKLGEIFVRGAQVAGEYRERKALDENGWFATRDEGWIDEAGYLFLAGRADDVIVRGGENISPGEIEEALCCHDAIADAAAVGVPSTEWGEVVGVAVTLRQGFKAPSIQSLQNLVRDRLRSSRVPEHVIVLDAMPYNEMGKLLRREVRELLAKQANCAELP